MLAWPRVRVLRSSARPSTTFATVFNAAAFTSDLSQWNVGQVTNMGRMCKWATAGVRGCWRGLVLR